MHVTNRTHRTRRSLLTLGLAATLALGLVACGDDDDDAAPAATTAPAAATTAAAAATTTGGNGAAGTPTEATEVIKQVSFTVKEVDVAVGGSVVFDNQDGQAHTATADDGSFDTGHIDGGTKKSVTFAKAGTFAFHCSIHPSMKATVVVS